MKSIFYYLPVGICLFLACSEPSSKYEGYPMSKPINAKVEGFEERKTANTPTQGIENDKDKAARSLRKELAQWHFSDSEKGLEIALQHIGHRDQFIRDAARVIIENNDMENWLPALQKVDNFQGEITLLTALVRVDSMNVHAQMLANRLQTFDLKHLNEMEQLAVIRLYELSLVNNVHPSENILQSAYAKLNNHFPAESEIVNKELSRTLDFLASQLTEN